MSLSSVRSYALSIATSGFTNSLTISFVDKFFNLQTDIDVSSENMVVVLNSSAGSSAISFTAPVCTTSPSVLCPIPFISNIYVMTFSVTRSGLFSLSIASFLSSTYRHLRGSPFSLVVSPGIGCGTLSKIFGSGLSIATAGVSAKYSVVLLDAWGNIPDLSQNVVRSFVTLSGAYDVSIEKSLNQNWFKTTRSGSNSMYAYSCTMGGLFATFWSSDFVTRRTSSVSNLDFSRNYDSISAAATNFGSRFSGFLRIPFSGAFTFSAVLAVATEKVKLSIDNVLIFNTFSAPQSSISATFQALRAPNAFYHIAVEYTSGINQNSMYKFFWSSSSSTTFSVIASSFLYYPNTITGSPFSLLVFAGPVHPTYSSGTGGFYSIITSGSAATFTVTLKDMYQNVAGQANQMYFDIIAADSSSSIPAVGVVRSSCLDSSGCPFSSVGHVGALQPIVTLRANSLNAATGTFQIAFAVTKSGKYIFRSRLVREGGLTSEYYNTMELKTTVSGITYTLDQMIPPTTQIDETPSKDWGLSSPSPGVIPVDRFSVRFRGYILGPCTCAVNLVFSSDYGLRVFVNGYLAIDRVPSFQSQISTTVDFIKGSLLPIVVEYVHNTGPSKFQIAWASSSWSLTEIPSSQFFFDASIGTLSQYMSVLPRSPIWSQPLLASSLSGFILTAGVSVSFSVSAVDSYGNPAYSFDSTKIFGKWNFPFQNVSGPGTASVTTETSTQVSFSASQNLDQGTRLYCKSSSNEHFFIGVLSAPCTSTVCNLNRASQIIFSSLPFYYVQNTQISSFPLTIVQLGDFASPFNGLTATYFSPHSLKFSSSPSLYPIKVLCQKGSFYDAAACDQTIDFSHPVPNGIITRVSSTFGVRWSGLLLTQTAGVYTIYGPTSSVNQVSSLRINGTSLFSEVASGSFATISVVTNFNTFHDIVVEYQKTSSADSTFSFQLKWKGPSFGISVIPSKSLFPLGSRFLITASPTLSQENISQISIGSYETKGLASTFYSDISGQVPIASLIYDTLNLQLVFFSFSFNFVAVR